MGPVLLYVLIQGYLGSFYNIFDNSELAAVAVL